MHSGHVLQYTLSVTVFVQYVNKSIQEKYIQQVFDAVLSSPEIENIQPKLGEYICIWRQYF